ncbi:MAG: hypothetical protein KJ871_14645 [Alphaproteobacteria bacterium]|nr:hypothetical protein [Alphaproteobacteria bacterium]MBU2085706.1 hypothetical protein [Alphaproteobacteria bacterium]MBU2141609.1 hypothetical protein [Alphaproteobacteria bacterium]MBU2197573.1 hypothetical protein [Alphaproteobacteria bacterium]
MAGRSGKLRSGAGPSSRALALAAFVIALGLLAWRGSTLLTADHALPASATPLEASLINLVDPVAGAGNARISVTTTAAGGRTVLVLLDAAEAARASTIESLVTTAARLDVAAGDLLVIQTAPFARGAPGRPDSQAYGELALLALLVGLAGWLGFAPRADSEVPGTTTEHPKAPMEAPVHSLTTTAMRPLRTVPVTSDVADLARKDPARAADILRGWMKNETDAA